MKRPKGESRFLVSCEKLNIPFANMCTRKVKNISIKVNFKILNNILPCPTNLFGINWKVQENLE